MAEKAYNAGAGVSTPFCVTWLAGLDPTTAGAEVGTCCYFIDYTFNVPTDAFADYPDGPGGGKQRQRYSVPPVAWGGN